MTPAVEAYRRGFIDGATAFARWKDGRQEVGTTGTLLKNVIENPEKIYNYNPPQEN